MAKLIYPSGNVYNYVNGNIVSCHSDLINALNNCSFQIPSGFIYTDFVNGLYSTIDSYVKEINDIKGKIKDTDTRLDNLSESLSRDINSVPGSIIEEKSRIIKF